MRCGCFDKPCLQESQCSTYSPRRTIPLAVRRCLRNDLGTNNRRGSKLVDDDHWLSVFRLQMVCKQARIGIRRPARREAEQQPKQPYGFFIRAFDRKGQGPLFVERAFPAPGAESEVLAQYHLT